ncbi:TrmB family transcriptional regulator [Halorubrum pallidum]|uniref:TrmB family transcriptional regulator n=1 Tax=Halorubrum pallidum TaxID=1526114 RepID=A0ABD5T7U0_9EURY
MSTDDASLREQLKSFGFSDKEVDTYTALLAHGEAKASDIAQSAGVSKRYVYNVFSHFEERGLVEMRDHETPTTARAVDPSTVVEQLSDRLSSLEEQLEAIHEPDPDVDRRYEVIKSNSTVRKRIARLIRSADNEVNVSVPASLLPDLAEDLEAAVDRGVFTLVLVNDDGTESVPEAALQGIGDVARVWEHAGPILVCVDRRHGLFSPLEVIVGNASDQQAIGFTEDRLSPLLVGSFLGNYWPLAEEVYVHDPDDLPATYDRFRHAVLAATLHRRRGRELTAEMEVRSANSRDDYQTRRGRVIRVKQKLVRPATNSVPIENSLVVTDGEDHYTVDGPGAITETFEARTVTLDVADDRSESVSEMVARSSKLDE